MTDQIPAGLTRDEAQAVREWAESIKSATNSVEPTTNPWSDSALAAARVILAVLPERPTLADMPDEERVACQWMQADVGVERRIIVRVMDVEEGAVTLVESGDTVVCPHSSVTPRPDLPRMEWPGTEKPAPTPALPEGWRLADHPEHGRVLVVRIFGDKAIYATPAEMLGIHTHVSLLSDLTFVDTDTVPPNTLAKGSEWDDTDALARACEESGRDQIVVADKDGDVFVWGVDAEWWETGLPGCDYAPHTIIHAGKKVDQ